MKSISRAMAVVLLACGGKEASSPPPATATVTAVDAGTLEQDTAEPATTSAAPAEDAGPPTPKIDVEVRTKRMVPVDGARVIAALRPRFRQCAAATGVTSGTVVVTFTVAANGEVSAYSFGGTASKSINECIGQKLRAASFDPPGKTAPNNVFEIELR